MGYWTTHLQQLAQSRHSAAFPIGDEALSQLQTLLWLHKTRPSDAPVTVDGLHLSTYVFREMPDIAALLSKIFTFQDSISSIERENRDLAGESLLEYYETLALCLMDI